MPYRRSTNRRRNYRRHNSLGTAVAEAGGLASVVRPRTALLFGVVLFVLFYWAAPAAIQAVMPAILGNGTPSSAVDTRAVAEKIINKVAIQRFELVGIAAFLVCAAVACWRALTRKDLDSKKLRSASGAARILARLLD